MIKDNIIQAQKSYSIVNKQIGVSLPFGILHCGVAPSKIKSFVLYVLLILHKKCLCLKIEFICGFPPF